MIITMQVVVVVFGLVGELLYLMLYFAKGSTVEVYRRDFNLEDSCNSALHSAAIYNSSSKIDFEKSVTDEKTAFITNNNNKIPSYKNDK